MVPRPPGLWVHRLSSDESGSPESAVTLDEVEGDLGEVARAVMVGKRFDLHDGAAEATAFLHSELFEKGVLRQGWGAAGMRADRASQFLKGYVIAAWCYWGAIPPGLKDEMRGEREYSRLFQLLEPYYRQAAGRLKIIERMVKMGRGDVVFLPNTPEPGRTFTVARIDDAQYRFEDRTTLAPRGYWEMDFGHRRQVRDVRTFRYGPETLPAATFGAPYRHAIDRVSAREGVLRAFLAAHFPG